MNLNDLKKITKNNYYDLVERMNRLLDNPSKDFMENIDYSLKYTLNNPDEYNDALYRLCLYYQTKKPSDYITYALLNRINFAADIHSQIPLLKLKARILQDIFSAKRALGKLKPEKKDSHRNIIGKERIKFVVKSVPTFSKVEKGYLEWGNFMINPSHKSHGHAI